MKKLQITIFVIAILFTTACSKNKDGSNESYRIKQLVYNSSNLTITYEYNNQNQITRKNNSSGNFQRAVYNSTGQLTGYETGGSAIASLNYKTDYIYNPTGIIQETITTYGDGVKNKYVYTIANGLQTGHKYYDWTGSAWLENIAYATTYSYNGANQRIKEQRKSAYYLYEYDERGNLNSIKQYYMKSDNSGFYLYNAEHFTYDNKKRMDETIQANALTKNKNNKLDEVRTSYAENGMTNSQQTFTYSYEYNAAGYVTKTFVNGVLAVTYTLEKI
jgi:YD repeat-containing protein